MRGDTRGDDDGQHCHECGLTQPQFEVELAALGHRLGSLRHQNRSRAKIRSGMWRMINRIQRRYQGV